MAKWVKLVFISSLALNVILIIGFILFRYSTNASIYRIGALNAQIRATSDRHILHELESGDPNKIKALEQYLRDSIELSKMEVEEYRNAAKN